MGRYQHVQLLVLAQEIVVQVHLALHILDPLQQTLRQKAEAVTIADRAILLLLEVAATHQVVHLEVAVEDHIVLADHHLVARLVQVAAEVEGEVLVEDKTGA